MVKKPIASIATIFSTVSLIMTCGFYYISHDLELLGPDKIITDYDFPENRAQEEKIAQKINSFHLWDKVYFPTDDYGGQELGRKIGDWVVEKIKN